MSETERPVEFHAATADCGLLYHYTSEEGLQGIIEHDNIRATHVRFLNDSSEFRHAFKEEYLGALAESFLAGLPKDVDQTARQVIQSVLSRRILDVLKIIESSTPTETFVCAFTSGANATTRFSGDPGDRLSQWRGYARSSQGFSLGFDPERLKKQVERVNSPRAPADLSRCLYDEEEKISFFQDLGRDASARFADLKDSGEAVPDEFRTIIQDPSHRKTSCYLLKSLSRATEKFSARAAQIKHGGFREEGEWRVVYRTHPDWLPRDVVKFRNGPFGLTPFMEIPLDLAKPETSALRRIVVGPSPHQAENEHSVELLLRKCGIQVRRPDANDGVEVATSYIPYRSM